MHFDPAIAAQKALQQAEEQGELGSLTQEIFEAEEIFSTDQGQEAKQAFDRLQRIGNQLPDARCFQEFLIYITWQQVTEETIPRHFEKGLELCNKFLEKFGPIIRSSPSYRQVVDIRASFQGGLGMKEEELFPELDEDTFKGGD